MRAVILAAGRSKRIKPIQDKNFLKFMGKTLIEHQIDNLKQAGFDKITIVGGAHNLEALKALNEDVVEQEKLDEGMAGAMMSLEPHLEEGEEILLLSANDFLEEKAFSLIKEAAEKSDAQTLLLAKKVESYFPGGYIAVDGNKVTEIVEKPGEGNEPSDMINIVLHWHKNPLEFIKTIKESNPNGDDWYEVAIDSMIKSGTPVEAVPYDGFWQAIKYPWHVLKLQEHFLSQIQEPQTHESAQIADSAVVKGPVIIEEGVRIYDHATVNGPVYIGKNSIVATNSLVRNSTIGENCVVGFGSEVARSHFADDIWLHTTYVGDSVICENVAFGAGAVTGNLRLDEGDIKMDIKGEKISAETNKLGTVIGANSRIGINVSIMPGMKIGKDSMIAGGLTIMQDIPDDSFVKGKVELEIRKNEKKVTKRDSL